MILDSKGDMGFNEAMLSMMVVSLVLGAYLIFISGAAVADYDPIEDFEVDSLNLDTSDGVEISSSYLFICLATMDVSGISVDVIIPGFIEDVYHLEVGECNGSEYSKNYIRVCEYADGRTVPAVIKVVAYC